MTGQNGLFYPHDSISFVLSLSDPGILLHLGCSGFTQGVKVVLRERDRREGDSDGQLWDNTVQAVKRKAVR